MTATRFPIEAGQILQFARAVGTDATFDDVDSFFEVAATGELPVPPTFTAASMHYDPDTPLRPRAEEPWCGSGRTPSGTDDQPVEAVSLHAEQHFEYFKPFSVGDVLTVTHRPGRAWERVGRRGGAMRFSETVSEFFDSEGDLVIRSTHVLMTPESVAGSS